MSLMTRLLTRNVGATDRVIRALPAVAFVVVWARGKLTGTPLVILGIVAAMLLVTAMTARCSIYAMLGLSTCSTKDARS